MDLSCSQEGGRLYAIDSRPALYFRLPRSLSLQLSRNANSPHKAQRLLQHKSQSRTGRQARSSPLAVEDAPTWSECDCRRLTMLMTNADTPAPSRGDVLLDAMDRT